MGAGEALLGDQVTVRWASRSHGCLTESSPELEPHRGPGRLRDGSCQGVEGGEYLVEPMSSQARAKSIPAPNFFFSHGSSIRSWRTRVKATVESSPASTRAI